MPAIQPLSAPVSEEEAQVLSERGLAIYENKLKSLLEPLHDNEFISIHVETEDYALGASSGEAMRAIRQRHPQGWLVMLKIGSEPEWGLAARLLLSDDAGMGRRRAACRDFDA